MRIRNLSLAICAMAVVFMMTMCRDKGWEEQMTDRASLERIMGVRLPSFEIVGESKGSVGVNGDFINHVHGRWTADDWTDLVNEVRQLSDSPEETNWSHTEDNFVYNREWGGWHEAFPDESADNRIFLNFEFSPESRDLYIRYGRW